MIQLDKEVIEAVERFLEDSSKDEYEASVSDFWDEIQIEQPHLIPLLTKMLKGYMAMEDVSMEERLTLVDTFAHGIFTLYFAMKKQEEINDMNENWGL